MEILNKWKIKKLWASFCISFKATLGKSTEPGIHINFGISEWKKAYVANVAPFEKPSKDFLWTY